MTAWLTEQTRQLGDVGGDAPGVHIHLVPLQGGRMGGMLTQRAVQQAGELLFPAHCDVKHTCSVQRHPCGPVHFTGFPHQL